MTGSRTVALMLLVNMREEGRSSSSFSGPSFSPSSYFYPSSPLVSASSLQSFLSALTSTTALSLSYPSIHDRRRRRYV